MALTSPQADLTSLLRGGSDTWDEGAAGLILVGEYFTTVGIIHEVGCSETSVVIDLPVSELSTASVISQAAYGGWDSLVSTNTHTAVDEVSESDSTSGINLLLDGATQEPAAASSVNDGNITQQMAVKVAWVQLQLPDPIGNVYDETQTEALSATGTQSTALIAPVVARVSWVHLQIPQPSGGVHDVGQIAVAISSDGNNSQLSAGVDITSVGSVSELVVLSAETYTNCDENSANPQGVGVATNVTTDGTIEVSAATETITKTSALTVAISGDVSANTAQVTVLNFVGALSESTTGQDVTAVTAGFNSNQGETSVPTSVQASVVEFVTSTLEVGSASDLGSFETSLITTNQEDATIAIDFITSVAFYIAQAVEQVTGIESTQSNVLYATTTLEALLTLDNSEASHQVPVYSMSTTLPSAGQSAMTNLQSSIDETTPSGVYLDIDGSTVVSILESAPSAEGSGGSSLTTASSSAATFTTETSDRQLQVSAMVEAPVGASSEESIQLTADHYHTSQTTSTDDQQAVASVGLSLDETVLAYVHQTPGLVTTLVAFTQAVASGTPVSVMVTDLSVSEQGAAHVLTSDGLSAECIAVEITPAGDDYLCLLVSNLGVDETLVAVSLQVADLNVIVDLLKLENVFLVSREVRGVKVSLDIRDIKVEMESRGYFVSEEIREIALAVETRSYNVNK